MVQSASNRSFVQKSIDLVKGLMECFIFLINSFFATAGSNVESNNFREQDLRSMQSDGENFKLWNNGNNEDRSLFDDDVNNRMGPRENRPQGNPSVNTCRLGG